MPATQRVSGADGSARKDVETASGHGRENRFDAEPHAVSVTDPATGQERWRSSGKDILAGGAAA